VSAVEVQRSRSARCSTYDIWYFAFKVPGLTGLALSEQEIVAARGIAHACSADAGKRVGVKLLTGDGISSTDHFGVEPNSAPWVSPGPEGT